MEPAPSPGADDELREDRLPFERRFYPSGRYGALATAARADPEKFWGELARELLTWERPFDQVLGGTPPEYRWFEGGELNAAVNCLERHLDGAAAHRVAYHWEGEDGTRRSLTYLELAAQVRSLAGAIAARGYGRGDTAAVYLPMVPELPVTMLALAYRGMPFTVVFSGFSAEALEHRMKDLGARLLFTAERGVRRGQTVPLRAIAERALEQCPKVDRCVLLSQPSGGGAPLSERELSWAGLLEERATQVPPTRVPSNHPLFLLYSSGTTGSPKGIVHGTAGYLLHVGATMRWVFDPGPRDVLWCAADVGWVTGHSYIVFAPLLLGATSVLYEGALDHPTPDRFWQIAERYRVSELYTSPTALRSLRRHGDSAPQSHDLSALRLLGSVGEPINPSVWEWYFRVVGKERCPVIDSWWQTETGGIMVCATPFLDGRPLKPGSATLPVPGIDVGVVGEDGQETATGVRGYAVVRRPWPGMLLGLWNDPERYRATYWSRFPGVYYTGDYAVRDPDGYLWFLGRADEVLKVAGHRIGTAEIEGALLADAAVAEAAVCAVPDPIRGEVPVAVVVLRPGTATGGSTADRLAEGVSTRIGRFARPAQVLFVGRLPRTRSGKIMRRVVRAVIVHGPALGDVTTLEDEASVDEVRAAAKGLASELAREKSSRGGPGAHPAL